MKISVISALFALLFITVAYPQYKQEFRDLSETVYKREFSKDIFDKYFKSGDAAKITAALFAVAQSADTALFSIIPSEVQNSFALQTAFAAGMCGRSEATLSFLRKKIFTENKFEDEFLYALGRTGTEEDATKLLALKNKGILPDTCGLGLCFFYFSQNKITSRAAQDLCSEILTNSKLSLKRRTEAAFMLFRAGKNTALKSFILTEFKNNLRKHYSTDTTAFYGFLAALLRKEKAIVDPVLISEMLRSTTDMFLKTELLKVQFNKPVFSTEEFRQLLLSTTDNNDNIALTTAQLIQTAAIPDSSLYAECAGIIADFITILPEPYRNGELFCAGVSFAENKRAYFDKYGESVALRYYVRCALKYFSGSREVFDAITKRYKDAGLTDKLEVTDYFIKAYAQPELKKEAVERLLEDMFTANPALAGNTAEKVDSNFIRENAGQIGIRMLRFLPRYINDADYLETMLSYISMLPYLEEKTAAALKNIFRSSGSAAVKAKLEGIKAQTHFSEENFSLFYKNAFAFKGAVIKTSQGSISIEFTPEVAPVTVGNFVSLVRQGFYSGVRFHRVVPGFVIQAGDPKYEGWGGPGYVIPSEFSGKEYKRGVMGMASAGRDTEGSQWFIMQGEHHHLNGRYTVFAEVTEGMQVVEKISMNDKIISIELIRR